VPGAKAIAGVKRFYRSAWPNAAIVLDPGELQASKDLNGMYDSFKAHPWFKR
jgi:hypothetical protein